MRSFLWVVFFLTFSASQLFAAEPSDDATGAFLNESGLQEEQIAQAQDRPRELVPSLPIWKEKAAKVGETLPMSLGASIAYLGLQRDIDVSNVEVGFDPANMQTINDFLAFDVNVEVQTVSARFDAWLFPFLNVYGILGEIWNESDVKVSVTLPPALGGGTAVLPTNGNLSGTVYGAGVTLNGGYNRFFMVLDNNITYAAMDGALDYKIQTLMTTVRVGMRDRWKNTNWRIWFGATRWDTDRNLSGSIPFGSQTLYFNVDQSPKTTENWNLGVNLEFHPRFNVVTEYGFKDDMQSILISTNFRF